MYCTVFLYRLLLLSTDVSTVQYLRTTLAGAWAGGTEYGVNFVLLNKIVCFVFMCHIVPICHFSVDLEFSHTSTPDLRFASIYIIQRILHQICWA
jgi:hypothetical protein